MHGSGQNEKSAANLLDLPPDRCYNVSCAGEGQCFDKIGRSHGGGSSNGRTLDSGSSCGGSNPPPPANLRS